MSFLDTSFLVDLLRERNRGTRGPAQRKLEELGDTPLYLSVFVACELEAGAALSRRQQDELRSVRKLCELCEVVYPDERFASVYGAAMARLRRQGDSIATMDLLIATAALIDRDTLITRNLKDFRKIQGLRVESY